MAQVHRFPFATGRLDFEALGVPGKPEDGPSPLPQQIPAQRRHREQGRQSRQESAGQPPLARGQRSQNGQDQEEE